MASYENTGEFEIVIEIDKKNLVSISNESSVGCCTAPVAMEPGFLFHII